MLESPTPGRPKTSEGVGSVEPERCNVDLHEVRLDLLEVDRHTSAVKRPGERAGTRVIVGEAIDVVVERIQTGSSDDPCLAHRASEQVLLTPRALHQLARAREQCAERAAEALREAERHRVEAGRDLRGLRRRARSTH